MLHSRDPRQRKKMAVIRGRGSATARPAQTRYELVQNFEEHSLVRCFPRTGRTHQIRVHLAYVGHPIVGDEVYGRRKQRVKIGRHFLHAASLTFNLPSSGREISLDAPLPEALQQVLNKLEAQTRGS